MPISAEEFQRKIEEYKEVGHEIRYREQMMLQEFSFSMIAGGVAVQAAERLSQPVIAAVAIQIFGTAFFGLLALHLRNINQDRVVAIHRKEALRSELEFGLIHQNIDGVRRLSAPRLMFWFSIIVASAWAVSTIMSIDKFFMAAR